MNSCRGATLIEIIVALALSTPIILGLIVMISSSVKLTAISEEQHRRVLTTRRIESIAAILSHDADRHRLPLLPRVHDRGAITFINGERLAVSPRIPANRPSVDSSAVTYLRLVTDHIRWVTKHHESGEIEACRPSIDGPPPDSVRGFITVSPEGIEHMDSPLTHGSGLNQRCIRTKITTLSKSMMTATGVVSPASVSIIIPIESVYTYFVSAGEELRLLSHEGEQTVEHQPVHDGVKSLSCAYNFDSRLGVMTYFLRLASPRAPTVEAHFSPKLSRMTLDETLIAYSHLQ